MFQETSRPAILDSRCLLFARFFFFPSSFLPSFVFFLFFFFSSTYETEFLAERSVLPLCEISGNGSLVGIPLRVSSFHSRSFVAR